MLAAVTTFREQRTPDYKGPMTSIRGLAQRFKVPYQTLQRRISGKIQGHQHKSGGKSKPRILSKIEEHDLIELLENFTAVGFPLTGGELKQVAYQYAQEHGIRGFSDKYQCAGAAWLRGFLERNPSLK